MQGWPLRIIDAWLNRRRMNRAAVQAARDRVAHLKPAVVVTGGSRGIGAALAWRFAEARSNVVVVARTQADLDRTAADIHNATGQDITTISCDVTAPDAFATITSELAQVGFYLDVLVNSAAIGLAGPFSSHAEDQIDDLIALNISGLTRLTRAVLPDMQARRRGGILNISSLGAYVPGPHQAAYYASKAYVQSLTEAIAAEASGQGLRIAVVLPGPVDTEFHAAMGAEQSLYRKILPSLTAERVARISYRGFTIGRRVIVPGLFNVVMFISLKLFPHAVTVPVVAWLLKRPER